jgi:glycosyltransferase involved in cell wall biosynthesis
MPTVLHVITGLDTGGAETALFRLIDGSGKGNYQHRVVTLMTGGTMLPVFRKAGIDVTEIDLRRAPLAGFLRLVGIMRTTRPDIVQTWMYHADLVGGLAARMAGNRNVIWGIRTTGIAHAPRATAVVRRLCAWLSGRVPHTIVCVADASRRAHVDKGYDGERMVVVHNGFNQSPAVGTLQRMTLRAQWGFDDSHVVVGHLGRFDPDKDLENFIRASGLLAPAHPQVRFVMIGHRNDAERAQLDAWVARTRYPERYALVRERADALECLAAMDVFCLSSRNEGFPVVVGEAMAAAVPCVVTDVGDTALLVGDTGVVVPREDSAALAAGLEQMMRIGPDGRRLLGLRANARVHERFTVRHTLERFEMVYSRVMEGGA